MTRARRYVALLWSLMWRTHPAYAHVPHSGRHRV